MELFQCSRQWATRPADERFVSLKDLHNHTLRLRDHSRSAVVSNRQLTIEPAIDQATGKMDHKAIQVMGPSGQPYNPTHHAFNQICRLVSAPAGYLRGLPSPVAADALNCGLKFQRDVEDTQILLTKLDGESMIRAATGPQYGRVWNSDYVGAIRNKFENTGFKVPGHFGKALAEVTKDNTTLYAGDRDMFIFLADEENRIEIPDRRAGKSGSLARGFFFWNSEVGDRTMGMAMFLFDYACMNRIVWGAQNFEQVTIRHTAGAPDKFVEEVMPAINSYTHSSGYGIQKAIADARSKRVDNIEVFLNNRFTKREAMGIINAHQTDEGRPMETLWDIATGVTAYARGIEYQDARVDLERKAGKILDLAS